MTFGKISSQNCTTFIRFKCWNIEIHEWGMFLYKSSKCDAIYENPSHVAICNLAEITKLSIYCYVKVFFQIASHIM